MNAPRLCKLRKNCPTSTGHGAMVLTKPLHFFFSNYQRLTKTIAHLPIAEGLSFRSLAFTVVNCRMKKFFIQLCSEFSLQMSILVA
jgi:hypothetical protein